MGCCLKKERDDEVEAVPVPPAEERTAPEIVSPSKQKRKLMFGDEEEFVPERVFPERSPANSPSPPPP